MFASTKTAQASAAPAPSADPNWPNVSLLLHGDGTNGAQNNTFIDSSSNAFTITRNGNATQGSLTPFGSLWSKYNAIKTDNLTIPNNSAIANLAGDFTVVAWVNPTDTSITSGWGIIDTRTSGGTAAAWIFMLWSYSSGGWLVDLFNGSHYTGVIRVLPNVWTHVAMVRSGSTVSYYVNGIFDSSYTLSGTITGGTGTISVGNMKDSGIGGYGNVGYISNLRLVNGTAIYTSAFTPSTSPLTAVTNTSLLAFQSNRFVDNSTYNATFTVSGSPKVQPFSPFSSGVAYDAATNGASGYFDGSGDNLSCTTATTLPLGMNPYTIEAFIRPNGMGRYGIAAWGVNSTNNVNAFRLDTASIVNYWYANDLIVSISSLADGGWHHVVAQFDGTTRAIYVDGVRVGFDTPTGHTISVNNNLSIGSTVGGEYFPGYLSNVRISNIARYSGATLTIPTAPFSSDANTIILIKGQNAGIYDNATQNDLETVGNAQISTSVKKYGTGSLTFDGAGDYLSVPNNSVFSLGTGNFTIECWVYTGSPSATSVFFNKQTNSSNVTWVALGTVSGNFRVWISSAGSSFDIASAVSFGSVATSTWQHIALVRNGTAFTAYLNGTGTSTATSSASIASTTNNLIIGGQTDTNYLNGYIDDLRITNGVARYTANFTPPTAAFPNY